VWLPFCGWSFDEGYGEGQGQHREAIRYLEQVLQISKEMNDRVGDADAYGTIADMYTELGQLELARDYYGKYMDTMATDGPV
jgi:tetratricopeptide (TPR) repeat protein